MHCSRAPARICFPQRAGKISRHPEEWNAPLKSNPPPTVEISGPPKMTLRNVFQWFQNFQYATRPTKLVCEKLLLAFQKGRLATDERGPRLRARAEASTTLPLDRICTTRIAPLVAVLNCRCSFSYAPSHLPLHYHPPDGISKRAKLALYCIHIEAAKENAKAAPVFRSYSRLPPHGLSPQLSLTLQNHWVKSRSITAASKGNCMCAAKYFRISTAKEREIKIASKRNVQGSPCNEFSKTIHAAELFAPLNIEVPRSSQA